MVSFCSICIVLLVAVHDVLWQWPLFHLMERVYTLSIHILCGQGVYNEYIDIMFPFNY